MGGYRLLLMVMVWVWVQIRRKNVGLWFPATRNEGGFGHGLINLLLLVDIAPRAQMARNL
jgi:hypothetical protein